MVVSFTFSFEKKERDKNMGEKDEKLKQGTIYIDGVNIGTLEELHVEIPPMDAGTEDHTGSLIQMSNTLSFEAVSTIKSPRLWRYLVLGNRETNNWLKLHGFKKRRGRNYWRARVMDLDNSSNDFVRRYYLFVRKDFENRARLIGHE